MPIDIDGWIEVKSAQSNGWSGKERLDLYLADASAYIIFGFGKYPFCTPVIGARELPIDISREVKADISSYRDFEKSEKNFSVNESMKFSFVTLEDALKHDIFSVIEPDSNWVRVFHSMRKFQDQSISQSNIRLIVWACY